MVGNGWKWFGNGLEMVRKWLEMVGNGWKWLEMVWKWLEMVGNGWKWLVTYYLPTYY